MPFQAPVTSMSEQYQCRGEYPPAMEAKSTYDAAEKAGKNHTD